MKKLLLFDLDGTLWDSSSEVADSWNIILEKRLPGSRLFTAKDIQSVMGKTMEEISNILLPDIPEEERSPLFDECQSFEVEYIAGHGGKLFPGVRETLSQLLSDGYRMAIVSNCQTGYIGAFLKSMNMSEYFCDYEEWGRTLKPKSHNIRLVMERAGIGNTFADPEKSDDPAAAFSSSLDNALNVMAFDQKAIYIGDTEKDMLAARDAGIPFIHAAYGFGKVPSGTPAIKNFAELPDLLIF